MLSQVCWLPTLGSRVASSPRHQFCRLQRHELHLHQRRHHHHDHPCHHQCLPGLAWCNFNAFKGMLIAGAQLPTTACLPGHSQPSCTTYHQQQQPAREKLPGRQNHSTLCTMISVFPSPLSSWSNMWDKEKERLLAQGSAPSTCDDKLFLPAAVLFCGCI